MLGASAFHTKPNETDDLRELLRRFHDYWCTVEVPESDVHGEMLHTEAAGKLGERFEQEKYRA